MCFEKHFLLLVQKLSHVVSLCSVQFHFLLSGNEASSHQSVESQQIWVSCACALPQLKFVKLKAIIYNEVTSF